MPTKHTFTESLWKQRINLETFQFRAAHHPNRNVFSPEFFRTFC